MRYRALFLVMLAIFWGHNDAFAFLTPKAKITVKIVGEDGNTIEGADVGISFELPKGRNNFNNIKGFSDAGGLFTASSASLVDASCGVEKNGYYKSYGRYVFKEGLKSGRWLPWNPTMEILLRKIEKPVPMYRRNTKMTRPRLEIPVAGKDVGFDLVKYDWLPPYGNGIKADFIFKLEKHYINAQDFDAQLTLTFSNKFDGIQIHKDNRKDGSLFKLPRYAPVDGYGSKLIIKKTPSTNDFQEDNNYFFRIRSEVDDGKLVRAMYGKIEGPIKYRRLVQKGARLTFIYYLNPDYTRNLEFGRNLFNH